MQTSGNQDTPTQSVRPRIGIPVRLSSAEGADARVAEANELFDFIVQLVRDGGGQPVLLGGQPVLLGGQPVLGGSGVDPAAAEGLESSLGRELETLDGVLLPGGGDLDPRLYGEEPSEACYDVNPEQDRLDLAVVRSTLKTDLPLLGICRGHQLINVAYGGTLIQDMAPTSVTHNGLAPAEGERGAWAWHDVGLAVGSRVAALYSGQGDSGAGVSGEGDSGAGVEAGEAAMVKIASGHHQAVARVGEGLVVTAVADDGTVEALEDPARWLATVQWHPEATQLPDAERLAPFKAFVEVCRSRAVR